MVVPGYRAGSHWRHIVAVFLGCWLLPLVVACGGQPSTDSPSVAPQHTVAPEASTYPPTATSTSQNASSLTLEALSMTSSSPDQGWVAYEVQLAVRNTSDLPIILSTDISEAPPDIESGSRPVTLQATDAQVNTDQKHAYPADVSTGNLDGLVIPGGAAVTAPIASHNSGNGWEFDSFSATFRVPEQLHPTQLSITPGLVYNGITTSVALDLANVPEQSTGIVNPTLGGASLASIQSGPLAVDIAAAPGSILDYHDPQLHTDTAQDTSPEEPLYYTARNGGYFVSVVDVTIKNTDITGDQPIYLDFTVLDGFGTIYQATPNLALPSGECSALPSSIGPGQSTTVHLCFGMPEADANGSTSLSLLVTSLEGLRQFALHADPENLTNCTSQLLPRRTWSDSYGESTIAQDQTVSVSGSVNGSIIRKEGNNYSVVDRVRIQSPGGQTASISLTPNSPFGSSTYWRLVLQDPSGATVYQYDEDAPDTSPPVARDMSLFCRGTYALYIRPVGTRTKNVNSQYEVTVMSELAPVATPQSSPEAR